MYIYLRSLFSHDSLSAQSYTTSRSDGIRVYSASCCGFLRVRCPTRPKHNWFCQRTPDRTWPPICASCASRPAAAVTSCARPRSSTPASSRSLRARAPCSSSRWIARLRPRLPPNPRATSTRRRSACSRRRAACFSRNRPIAGASTTGSSRSRTPGRSSRRVRSCVDC